MAVSNLSDVLDETEFKHGDESADLSLSFGMSPISSKTPAAARGNKRKSAGMMSLDENDDEIDLTLGSHMASTGKKSKASASLRRSRR